MTEPREPRSTTSSAERSTPVRGDETPRETRREDRPVREPHTTRGRGSGLSDLFGSVAKAGLWMVLGAVLVIVLLVVGLLALIF